MNAPRPYIRKFKDISVHFEGVVIVRAKDGQHAEQKAMSLSRKKLVNQLSFTADWMEGD